MFSAKDAELIIVVFPVTVSATQRKTIAGILYLFTVCFIVKTIQLYIRSPILYVVVLQL